MGISDDQHLLMEESLLAVVYTASQSALECTTTAQYIPQKWGTYGDEKCKQSSPYYQISNNSEEYTGDGSVHLQGNAVLKRKTGNWRTCPFILGAECCECLAYSSISKNMVNYLTTKLHEGNATAAKNVSNWSGTCFLTPLIGAFFADAYWGRYWTIAAFSTIYFIGMCTLALSASIPSLKPADCVGSFCPSATPAQDAVFFIGLYLIALGVGGIKPCISPFGADQFDDTDPIERSRKGSFFNWLYFFINVGSLVSSTVFVWIQENVGWDVGFGIPAVFMGIAIATFFSGTPLYRFHRSGGSPLTRICQVIVASFRKRKLEVPQDGSLLYETPDKILTIGGIRKMEHTEDMKCLDKAAVISDYDVDGDLRDPWILCTVTQVEEMKLLIHMCPIWATGIIYSATVSQMQTLFIEQGMVMDKKVGTFTVPAASFSLFNVISIIILVPVYDKLLVPTVRKFTGKDRGFSDLQRIGIGLFISFFAMVSAALVEIKRLQIVDELGLVNEVVPAPLSIFWQIPQYVLFGLADIFISIGQMEFSYNQAPDAMRSLCNAFNLLSLSLGIYLSSLILSIVTIITTSGGKAGWIPDNLNNGRLHNFFWLLAGLSILNLLVYIRIAMKYKPKNAL